MKIAIIVLFVLLTFLFVFFISVFFINKKYRLKVEYVKKRFNNIVTEDFVKKAIPIEHIGYSDPKYESIANLFNMFGTKFEVEIMTVKEKIFMLSSILKNFDFKNFKKLYFFINEDIDDLETSIELLNELQQHILEYKNYTSFILVSYRENAQKIISFYEKNLWTIFNDKVINDFVDKLKKHCVNLNTYVDQIDLKSIKETLEQFNTDFTSAFNLMSNWYIWNKQHKYVKHTVDEIEKVLKSGSKKLSHENNILVNKKLTLIYQGIASLDKKMSNHNFEKIETAFYSIIKDILFIKKTLQLNFKSTDFLSKNKDFILENFNVILIESKNLFAFLNKIFANFYSSQPIKDETIHLKDQLTLIKKKCNAFIAKNNKVKYDSSELFVESKNIIGDILDMNNAFENLITQVNNKYSFFKMVLNEISSSKLLLAQLLAFIKNNEIDTPQTIINDISKVNNELNTIEINFFTDYDKEFDYNYNLLLEIKQQIYEISLSISSIYFKKIYVENLISYANILMINNNINVNLDEVYTFYQKGKYFESLKKIVKLLKPYPYTKYSNVNKIVN